MPATDTFSMGFSIHQKIVFGFALAASLMLLVALLVWRSTEVFLSTARQVAHSRQVLEMDEMLLRDILEAESGERGFVITGDTKYLLSYTSAWVLISRDVDRLKKLTADNLSQQKRLAGLEPLIRRKLDVLKENISARQFEGSEKAFAHFAKGEDREVMQQIRTIMSSFESEEQRILREREAWFGAIGTKTTVIISVGTVAGILLLGMGSLVIVRDVLARRRAEESLAEERNLFRTLIETIPHQVYVKDLEGRYLFDNTAHRKYLGVSKIEEVVGKKPQDFFPDDLAEVYLEIDEKVKRTGEPVLYYEEPAVDREGNLVWHSTSKVPLRDTSGKLIGLVCLSEDITDRKNSDEKRRHILIQMERSNRELQDFASVASHDLQEPLRKILAFGDRLKVKCADALSDQGKDYVERMLHAANRMRVLINDLLSLSRVTSAAKPFAEVDLAKIARDTVNDLEVQIEQTGASVEIGFMPRIEADASQIRQLMQNLISNALKFHAPGTKPVVSISAKILEVNDYRLPGALPGSEVCQIMVRDNGIGFDESYAEKIFAVFQRLHGRSEYEGTGIGLAVCRKITDRHGGSIMAKSSTGDGATFIVTLPVKQNIRTTNEYSTNTNNYLNG